MPFATEPSHVSDAFRLLKSNSLNIFILKCCDTDLVACKKKKQKNKANKQKISHFYWGSERSDIGLTSLLTKGLPTLLGF